MIDVDSDTSTNDTVIVLANGLAGGEPIDAGHPAAGAFRSALTRLLRPPGQGHRRRRRGSDQGHRVRVEGAASPADARRAAREVVRSLAVKTAVYGCDPNWGRILAAVGNSGAEMIEEKTVILLSAPGKAASASTGRGRPCPSTRRRPAPAWRRAEVHIRVDLGLGEGAATAWGSDITEEYVRLNSAYTT